MKNATRVKYNIHARDMVIEVPEFAVPPPDESFDEISPIDLPAVAANLNLPIRSEGSHYWEQHAEVARRQAREESQRFAAETKSREEARNRFAAGILGAAG